MLYGVNVSGAEFAGTINPGTYGPDYAYPADSELQYFADKGFNLFRIPFRMERWFNDPRNGVEMRRIVNWCAVRGFPVILDAHDYGKDPHPSTTMVDTLAFADRWRRIAIDYRLDTNVVFGIMNEPIGPAVDWYVRVQAAISAIRGTGAMQPVLVNNTPGGQAQYMPKGSSPDQYSAAYFTRLVDPGYNMIFEGHTYFDTTHSGTSGTVSVTVGRERTQGFIDWCRHHRLRAFIGEFAGSKSLDKGPGLLALADFLSFMNDNSDVLWGWTVWGGGQRWNPTYHFRLSPDPTTGAEQPQIAILQAAMVP